MSSFQQAAEVLGGFHLKLFTSMASSRKAIPMEIGIREQVLTRLDPAHHRRATKALAKLAHSQSYLTALRRPHAQRHDVDGGVIEPVSPAARQLATERLQEIKRHRDSR